MRGRQDPAPLGTEGHVLRTQAGLSERREGPGWTPTFVTSLVAEVPQRGPVAFRAHGNKGNTRTGGLISWS